MKNINKKLDEGDLFGCVLQGRVCNLFDAYCFVNIKLF